MTVLDPGGSASPALDVDRVEWLPGERGTLEVRVFGTWRGSEPADLAFLLVDDGRHRHMFPALSTPPTSGPGRWSAAFPVPGELRPALAQPLALRVGLDEVGLPAARAGAEEEPEQGEVVDRAVLAERRARRAELAEEELGRRAGEAERAAAALEAQLGGLEERLREVMAERDEALARLRERDRAVLVATQREHAERALREEAEEERHHVVAALSAELEDARARLADVEGRAEEAERLHARLIDVQALRADLEARAQAAEEERAALAQRLGEAEEERAALAQRLGEAQTQRTDLVARLEAVEEQRGALSERVALLEAERDELTVRAAEAEPVAAAQGELAGDLARTLRAELADERARREQDLVALRADLGSAIDGLRTELARFATRALPAVEAAVPETPTPAPPLDAGSRSPETGPQEPAGEPSPRPAVDPTQSAQLTALAEELDRARPRPAEHAGGERLVADLGIAARRLRENGNATHDGETGDGSAPTATPPEEPEPPQGPSVAETFPTRVVPQGDRYEDEWLAEAVEAIAEDDTALAARIVVALLPAQRHVLKRPLRYDLAIEGAGTYRVQIDGDEAQVEPCTAPAPGADDVDFRVSGPVRSVGRLATGSTRWRLRGARVQGSRRRLWRLLRARRDPLSLAALARAGERLDPGLAFTLLARAVDRRWTDDHPLEVTYRVTGDQEVAWHVATTGGAPLTVSDAPPPEGATGLARAVVEVPEEAFLPLLAREPLPEGTAATVTGDPDAVARLHAWFDRVQGLPIAD